MPKRFSTKNLTVVRQPTREEMGVGIFEFTDDYSVFHYGKMPDRIPGKGEAICRMTVANFQLLAEQGIATHFKRFVPPNKLEFHLARVINPELSPIPRGERNYLVPLQVVYRNSLPPGASVFRRLESGSVTLDQLGLAAMPRPGDRLERPLIEFTTKLEEIDRFINEEEARAISALSDEQMSGLKQITLEVNEIITRKAESIGLEHADGKIEFAIADSGAIVLVDSVGTPDENRFTFEGFHVGKQVLRDYYASTGIEKQVQQWVAMKRPRDTWPTPEPLPADLVLSVSRLYESLCEAWIGALAQAVQAVKALNLV
jgi:phosphoribosylaminoimidazole-succinocarboxamide synthase